MCLAIVFVGHDEMDTFWKKKTEHAAVFSSGFKTGKLNFSYLISLIIFVHFKIFGSIGVGLNLTACSEINYLYSEY